MSELYVSDKVNLMWDQLCGDPINFLRSRDPLEDQYLECKASVFTEPLYDEALKLSKINRKKSRKLLYHDNLFRTVEAIAAMANNDEGGIVLLGVASAEGNSIPDDGSPLLVRGMRGKDTYERYKRLERGIRLGKALVIGIDHELPKKRASGPVDRQLDTFQQQLSGTNSILFGNHPNRDKSLRVVNDWFCIGIWDPIDEDSWPIVEAAPWIQARWCDTLGSQLCVGCEILPVHQDGKKARIAALKIRHSSAPIYYELKFRTQNKHKIATKYF